MVNNVNNGSTTAADAEKLKKQAEARQKQKADSMKSSNSWTVDVKGTYSQDTTKNNGAAETANDQTKTSAYSQAQKKIIATPKKKTTSTASKPSAAANHSAAPSTVKKSQTHTTKASPKAAVTNTPPSIVKTGVFNPPAALKDFQSISMPTKQNPVAESGGIRFYSPNSEDPAGESKNIQTKVDGDNTIITIGKPGAASNNSATITIPTSMIAKNEENGAAVIYDKTTETYAFCNLEGAKIKNPKQDAQNSYVDKTDRKTVQGEKVFMQGCKGCVVDSNDTNEVSKDGTVIQGKGAAVASSGSSESYAIFDCQDMTVKASGDNDKMYVQNSDVSIETSGREGADFRSSIDPNKLKLDVVRVATDGVSTVSVKQSNQSIASNDLVQTGFDASTFVPEWFGTDAKSGAQVPKNNITGTTAAKDGSATVAQTGTFAADARYTEFSGLNMKGQAAFKSVGGISFFAPNETDQGVLSDLVTVQSDDKNTTITMNGPRIQGQNSHSNGRTRITIPNDQIEANKKNGAAVIFDPKTETFAYCNLVNADMSGAYQTANDGTKYAENFAFHPDREAPEVQGEKNMFRGCRGCTYNNHDLQSVYNDGLTSMNLLGATNVIGSGSKEVNVLIDCKDMTMIAGGNGDQLIVENSTGVKLKATNSEELDKKVGSNTRFANQAHHFNVNVSADGSSSVTLSDITAKAKEQKEQNEAAAARAKEKTLAKQQY